MKKLRRKYQAGGMSNTGMYGNTMYGSNSVMPGMAPTTEVVYGQADTSKIQGLMDRIAKEGRAGQYTDAAEESIQSNEQKFLAGESAARNLATTVSPLVKGAAKGAAKSAAAKGFLGKAAGKLGGMGLGAGIGAAGMLTSAIANDDDATTTNVGENIGGALSGAGTGMMIGSLIPGPGTLIGGVLGGLYGLGKGLFTRNAARRKIRRAEEKERKREAEINRLKGVGRLESMKEKTYGFSDRGERMYMYGGPMGYYRGGGRVPGGQVAPIPGTNAVEFKGRSHENGGIHLDPRTEVEGGETMDDVQGQDYIFSDTLKYNGKTFADRHKEILRKGGSVEKLAMLQEQVSGRAGSERGMMRRKDYQTGGFPKTLYDYYKSIGESFPSLQDRGLIYSKAGGQGNYTGTPTQNRILMNALMQERDSRLKPMAVDHSNSLVKVPAGASMSQSTGPGNGPTGEGTMTTTSFPGGSRVYSYTKPMSAWDSAGKSQGAYYAPGYADSGKPTVIPELVGRDNEDDGEDYSKYTDRGIPGLAIAGGIAQAAAPIIGAIRSRKSNLPIIDSNDPDLYIGNVAEVNAPRLRRVKFDAERAAGAASSRAINRSIDTAGMGPAGIVLKQSMYEKRRKADEDLASKEARENARIANQEAGFKMTADTTNAGNLLRKHMFNKEMRGNIERFNAGIKYGDTDRFIAAMDALGQRIAGFTGDVLSYKAQERLAQAIGSDGVYERDNLRDFFKGQTNKKTGKPFTDKEIDKLVSGIWNGIDSGD